MSYTHLNPGIELELSERTYFSPASSNISSLVALSPEELKQMEQASVEQEKDIYKRLKSVASEWLKQAGHTLSLRKALKYLETPETPHTSNQWVSEDYDWHTLSNMVYKFTYRISNWTEWDHKLGKSVPTRWDLSWYVVYNTPDNPDYSGHGRRLAGQTQKSFKDKTAMEKYLQGRIKAYAHLFTEISPPIPQEDRNRFCINGVLLPGYTVENPDALKPNEAAVDELLALLSDDELGNSPVEPDPQPEEKTPQEIWAKNRKQRTGTSQKKTAPTR